MDIEYIAEVVDEISGTTRRITVLKPEPEEDSGKIVVKERRVALGKRLFPTGWNVKWAKEQRVAYVR